MGFAGLRGTGDWGTDERPKNFRESILWMQPNGSAPLTALMARAKSESVNDPEFSWWEEKLTPVRVRVNDASDLNTTDTTVVLDVDGYKLKAGDILQVEKSELSAYDNELLRVASVTNDTTIVVVRGAANSTPANILDNTYLTKIGSAYGEGTDAPGAVGKNPTKVTNYCQIFKTAVELTNTAAKTYARTGDPMKNDKKRATFEHSIDMEMALLFGKAYETTDTNGKPLRYTAGLRSRISTNVTIFSATPTEDTFLTALTPVFNYAKDSQAGDERIVFAGNGALNMLNQLVRGGDATRINYDGVFKVYGMNLQKWVLPQGTLGIKTHPLLNLHGLYTNSMFVVDPSNIIYRHLRDTKYEPIVQTSGKDSEGGQWITEAGFEIRHEETMAYIGGFTTH